MSFRFTSFALGALIALAPVAGKADAVGGAFGCHLQFDVIPGVKSDLTNFPLLVRISESQMRGFKYERAADKEKLLFTGEDGVTLAYDVDVWNTNGESLVWVMVPRIPADGSNVTLHWDLTNEVGFSSSRIPENVWADYVGVWHMADATDSTSRNSGTKPSSAKLLDGDTILGKAISRSNNRGGPFITVTQNDAINNLTNDAFTASMWVWLNDEKVKNAFLFGRRKDLYANQGYGVCFYSSTINDTTVGGVARTHLAMYSGNANEKFRQYVPGITTNEWVRLDFVFAEGLYQCWVDGELKTQSAGALVPALLNGKNDFAIGGAIGNLSSLALNGAIDEFRLRAGTNIAAQVAAEYANVSQRDYVSTTEDGFIRLGMVIDGSTTNDFWTVRPALSINEWEAGYTVGFTNGVLRSGNTDISYSVLKAADGSVVSGPFTASEVVDKLKVLSEGEYTLLCKGATEVDDVEIPFSVKFPVSSLFEDHVTLTVNGIADGAIVSNFVMLVRVSETKLPGFLYSRVRDVVGDVDYINQNLMFTDENGKRLAFDVDTWNPEGESLLWVLIPEAKKGSRITMHWAPTGTIAETNEPTAVWADYAGVWHMNDGDEVDATGENETSQGDVAKQRVGVVGAALGKTETGITPIITIKQTEEMKALASGTFTVSFWSYFNSNDMTYGPPLFSSRETYKSEGWSGRIITWGDLDKATGDNVRISYGSGDSQMRVEGLSAGVWLRNDVVFSPTSVSWYINGIGASAEKTGANSAGSDCIYIGAYPVPVPGMEATNHAGLDGFIDEFRIRIGSVDAIRINAEHDNATDGDYLNATVERGSFLIPGLVTRTTETFDYWLVRPSLSATEWVANKMPDMEPVKGVLRSGDAVETWCENLLGDWSTNEVSKAMLSSLGPGSYRIYCVSKGSAKVKPAYFDFTVMVDTVLSTVGETASGRILLMNNDFSRGGSAAEPAIGSQGYSDTNTAATVHWEFANREGSDPAVSGINAMPGTESILWHVENGETNKLWHLVNCRHGNTFSCNVDDALSAEQNYLPYSTNSCSITNGCVALVDRSETGQLLMCNDTAATVYSPCYKDGIGTIYFDVVNGWTNIDAYVTGNITNNAYQLTVEYAKFTTNNLMVVDGNLWMRDENGAVTNWYGHMDDACWTACQSSVVRVSGGSISSSSQESSDGVIPLAAQSGGTTGEFYRVYARLDIREPVRFRIRRTSIDNITDSPAYILLDNIIVSPPRMAANLRPADWYDADKAGQTVLGYSGAFEPAIPSIRDEIYAKAVPGYEFSSLTNSVSGFSPTDVFASAKMHYRWRYLDQTSNEWQVAELDPNNGFKSRKPLSLPSRIGDVEFWYETRLQVPYYSYVDYSGLDLADDFSKIYSERSIGPVTNKANVTANFYPTKGRDWFVRLREHSSEHESVSIRVYNSDGTNYGEYGDTKAVECTTSTNGQWRGLLKTLDPAKDGTIKYHIEVVDLGDEEGARLTNIWYGATALRDGVLSTLLNVGDANDWSVADCVAKTGYLMFLIGEGAEPALTVTHADYQNFNGWTDAVTTNRTFVGCYEEDDKKSGVSPRKASYEDNFSGWEALDATNDGYWAEPFNPSGGSYAQYKKFTASTDTMNNMWQVNGGGGMWVDERYYPEDPTKLALQLFGGGKGSMEMKSVAKEPRGIENISLQARLAQSLTLDDVAYDMSAASDESMTNYCFVVQAAMSTNLATSGTSWNSNFDGPGQISLFAGFHEKYGGYEFRVLRKDNNRFKFELWKWTGKNASEKLVDDAISADFWRTPCAGILEVGVAKYATYFVSIEKQSEDSVRVKGGVSYGYGSGNGHSAPGEDVSGGLVFAVSYLDSDNAHTGGGYGMASANCPAVFVKPRLYRKSIGVLNDEDTNSKHWANVDPSGFNTRISELDGTKREIRWSDLVNKYRWSIPKTRFEAAKSINGVLDCDGLYATATPQKLSINLTANGVVPVIIEEPVSSFSMEPVVCNIYAKDSLSIKISTGIDSDDDIVIDDIALRQWSGDSYGNHAEVFKDARNGARTNFVYTTAWVHDDKSVELSAARASSNEVCSIRSPVMADASDDIVGLGLGMFAFSYTNANRHARLILQKAIADSGDESSFYYNVDRVTALQVEDNTYWENVTTFDFSEMSDDDLESGVCSYYIGDHGVVGAMRIVVDPAVISEFDAIPYGQRTGDYGRVFVTRVFCRDEPALDTGCWWGWNLRTGNDRNAKGDDRMRNINDWAVESGATLEPYGLALALNNSVYDDLWEEEPATYKEHLPFVQTPTFGDDVKVGAVYFKARRYDTVGTDVPARVTVYGATSGDLDSDSSWEYVDHFIIENDTYETYSVKKPNGSWKAFRFVVSGVKDVENQMGDSDQPEPPEKVVRVLIDEVIVAQVVRPEMKFRNVFAFRSDLFGTEVIDGFGDSNEQPLAGENWGVQAEVYASQLPDEIDYDSIKVTLCWFRATERSDWGYSKWKSSANTVELKRASDSTNTNLVFRSSYALQPDSIVSACDSGDIVQYMLLVDYDTKESGVQSDELDGNGWEKPEWYNGIDYNATKSPGGKFTAAYCIIDTVAPHWAWINEVNLYGGTDSEGFNVDKNYQWVEVAIPEDADISDWKLEFISNNFVTNACKFGLAANAKKVGDKPVASNCVFLVVASPNSESSFEHGWECDGTWSFENADTTFLQDGTIYDEYPIGIRLVRQSGIIEDAIVAGCTNMMMKWPSYAEQYRPETVAKNLGGSWCVAGDDSIVGDHSLSVTNDRGMVETDWSNLPKRTPGRINDGQVIYGVPPRANGSTIIVKSLLDLDFGHIRQTFGEKTDVATNVMLAVAKGSTTNIWYTLDDFYELDNVKIDGASIDLSARRGVGSPNRVSVPVTVAADASNDMTVEAKARVAERVGKVFDLSGDYADAVMDWLRNGRLANGDSFESPNGELYPAKYKSLSGAHEATLTLEHMYWLDIDPTISNWVLRAGICNGPDPREISVDNEVYHGLATNVFLGVYLCISNETQGTEHLPYFPTLLRGRKPGVTSKNYFDDPDYQGMNRRWDGPVFAILGQPLTGFSRSSWFQMRCFLFGDNSFLPRGDENEFQTTIEIGDSMLSADSDIVKAWESRPGITVYSTMAVGKSLRPFGEYILTSPTNFVNASEH